ncbi:hypothetical protein GCM10009616_14190 [Microlunatus lacustris]
MQPAGGEHAEQTGHAHPHPRHAEPSPGPAGAQMPPTHRRGARRPAVAGLSGRRRSALRYWHAELARAGDAGRTAGTDHQTHDPLLRRAGLAGLTAVVVADHEGEVTS